MLARSMSIFMIILYIIWALSMLRSEVQEVGENAPCLSQSSHILPQDLPWPLDVQNEMASEQAELGFNGLVVWVSMEELGEGGVPFSLLKNH